MVSNELIVTKLKVIFFCHLIKFIYNNLFFVKKYYLLSSLKFIPKYLLNLDSMIIY